MEGIRKTYKSSEGFTRVEWNNGKYSFIDSDGNFLEILTFDPVLKKYSSQGIYLLDANDFKEGFAAVEWHNGIVGFIDRNGKLFGGYRNVGDFNEGFAAVEVYEDKWTFVDSNRKLQKEIYDGIYYKFAEDYSNGFAAVELDDGKWTFVDSSGKLQDGRYEDVDDYSEGVQLDDGKWAFIDQDGKLQKGRYRCACSYSEGFAAVELDDGEWAFVDQNGELQSGRYIDAGSYHEGFARVMLDCGQWTFVDKHGKLQLGRYTLARDYYEGFAAVMLHDENWAFVDRYGKLQDGRYLWVFGDSYVNGFASVKLKSGLCCDIDYKGNLMLSEGVWKDYISKKPQDYKFIPPDKFEDKDFMKEINKIMKTTLINYITHSPLNNSEELLNRIKRVDEIIDTVITKNKYEKIMKQIEQGVAAMEIQIEPSEEMKEISIIKSTTSNIIKNLDGDDFQR